MAAAVGHEPDSDVVLTCSAKRGMQIIDARSAGPLITYRAGTGLLQGKLPHGVTSVGPYLFAVIQTDRPAVNVWRWQSDQVYCRCSTPEKLSCITATTDGSYLVGGTVSGRLYIWHVGSGRLLKAWDGHYRKVSVVRFTSDGHNLISGGDDACVNIWRVARLVDRDAVSREYGSSSTVLQPLHSLSSHSLPITDIHVGHSGMGSRIVTVSLDHMCKVWDIESGAMLSSITFPEALTAVVMDAAELQLFVGTLSGNILCTLLYAHSKEDPHLSGTSNGQQMQGHTLPVTSLTITRDGGAVVSASDDGSVRVWDAPSRQSIKTLLPVSPDDAICGIVLIPRPANLYSPGLSAAFLPPFAPLQRHVHQWGGDGAVPAATAAAISSLDGVPVLAGISTAQSSLGMATPAGTWSAGGFADVALLGGEQRLLIDSAMVSGQTERIHKDIMGIEENNSAEELRAESVRLQEENQRLHRACESLYRFTSELLVANEVQSL